MRLHTLAITAFGPFGTTQEIDFDALSAAGLFLLHGPTGAGKTSVLDAVCYALYGAVPGARQSPGTSLRSDHAPVDLPTEVRLELTVGGRRLEITRRPAQPRPKKRGGGHTTEKAQSWLRAHDPEQGWQALSRSHQEIGEEITQLIGMSRDQFCQVVLLPQGDFARFLRADAEARGRLLGRLFDTRRFAAVEERLADLRRAAESQVRAGDEQILALAQRIAQAAARPAASGRCPRSSRANPDSPTPSWPGPRRPAAAPGNGWTSPVRCCPRPRAGTPRPGRPWTPNGNWPDCSKGTRRPGAVPPRPRRAGPRTTRTGSSCGAPARRTSSPLPSNSATTPGAPISTRARPATAPGPGCPPPWPTRVPNNWRHWNEDSARSSAGWTPHVAPSGAARRSTTSVPHWSGRPGRTTS